MLTLSPIEQDVRVAVIVVLETPNGRAFIIEVMPLIGDGMFGVGRVVPSVHTCATTISP